MFKELSYKDKEHFSTKHIETFLYQLSGFFLTMKNGQKLEVSQISQICRSITLIFPFLPKEHYKKIISKIDELVFILLPRANTFELVEIIK